MCEQSEFGAALGVARLAMFVDNDISDKSSIISKIKIKNTFNPNEKILAILEKRYQLWKDIYISNRNLNYNL